tara:strand:+ start:448 stop:1431 length:984 start_codon:yes stop_codon:yes gene_type:complete
MAEVIPLILDGSNNLIEMTTAQINAVKDRCRYLYGSDPSVALSIVTSGGSLGSFADTRLRSGAAAESAGNQSEGILDADPTNADYPQESETAEPAAFNATTYSKVDQNASDTTASADTNNVAFPIYQTSGNIQAMSLTDVYDTFIKPALNTVAGAVGQPGTYRMHTSNSLSGYTNLGLVFTDTRANTGAFTAAQIGEPGTFQQHGTSIQSFYLLSKDNIAAPSMEQMLFIRNSDKNIEEYTQAEMDTFLKNSMRHVASEVTGSKIRYKLDTGTDDVQLGSGIVDTILTGGDGVYTQYRPTANEYRAQEFPDGTAATAATYNLRMYRA